MIQFDCHAHVYEGLAAVAGARYAPERPAPLRDWRSHLARAGLRGGVIVQVSFLGRDNAELCAALATLDRARFAGVAVVGLDAGEDELDQLAQVGVRGARWNLVRGAEPPALNAAPTRQFLEKLRKRGWHLEVHLEGPRLAPLLPALADLGVDLVIDHFGLPSAPQPNADPMIAAVAALADRGALHFKFSADYRTPFSPRDHARALLDLLPDHHVVWGSDWPHTQNERRASFADAHGRAGDWGLPSDMIAARKLYGIV